MKKIVVIGLAVLSGLVLWGYAHLGGFEELKFEQTQLKTDFNGNRFEGRYKNSQIEKYFITAAKIADEDSLANLSIINYRLSKDSLFQMIGIVKSKPTTYKTLPVDTTINGRFIKTTIRSHNLVMPKPIKVLAKAKAFAEEKGLKIKNEWTLEVYKGDRNLEIYYAVVE